jgi:mannitol/fructose-specific phosphotransferase system IIA component (Ntr-type)
MVMSVGRALEGEQALYIFVIGVPVALASDYLRIIGALARIFKDPQSERELRTAKTSEEFVELLVEREMRL